MRISILFFIFFSFSDPAISQGLHFLYSDSFNASGISPAPALYIQQNHIKKVSLYRMNKAQTDSVHFKDFIYDLNGNLVKDIIYGKNGVTLIDSFVYDDRNRKISEYMKSKAGIILQSSFHYLGDTVTRINTYMLVNDKIDTTYRYDYFNENRQLLNTDVYGPTKELRNTYTYTYTESGLPKEMHFSGSANGGAYGYLFQNIVSSKKRKIILFDPLTKKKMSECLYNEKAQCISCIHFYYHSDRYNKYETFHYREDGALFERIENYINYWSNKPVYVISRYYYL